MKIINYEDLENPKYKNAFFETIQYENNAEIDKIITSVKDKGDSFLIEISNKFKDGNFNSPKDFLVSEIEVENAYKNTENEFIEHINFAKKNIEEFAKKQLDSLSSLDIEFMDSKLGHKIIPLEKVLCYVPGGNYPLVSSCLMTVIPSKVAGVKEVFLTSPRIKDKVIVAAHLAGADKIYKLGGAQAISAFTHGTETIPSVDKIVGPGNKFVTYAKKSVYGKADIDFLAGPSEVMIIADKFANPKLIAADILAQSEHDLDARGYLVTDSFELAQNVLKEAEQFLNVLPTKDIAKVSFSKSFAVVVNNLEQAVEITNKRAPEHLELMLKNSKTIQGKIKNFGSLFVGENCAEVFGDYSTGTNHVLPTNSAARYTGGLSVFDFIKIVTYQEIGKDYAKKLAKTSSFLAKEEGLFAHKLASDLRGNNG